MPFRKPQSTIREWIGALQAREGREDGVQSRPQVPEDVVEEKLTAAGVDEKRRSLPSLTEYERFISESRAYQWLLSTIESYFELEARGEDRMASIGDGIRSRLLSHPALRNVSRAALPVEVTAKFSLNWNPFEFITEQECGVPAGDVFDHLICLTGTFQQAQAMTIAGFLEQTWPLTYQPLQALLKDVLARPAHAHRQVERTLLSR